MSLKNRKTIYQLCCLLLLQQSLCNPINSREASVQEELEAVNSQLRYFCKRFAQILKTADASYVNSLEKVIQRFTAAAATDDLQLKVQLVAHYDDQWDDDLHIYVRHKLDEQYLNEEILLERWYMEQLLPQLEAPLAAEIVELLPKYDVVLVTAQLDKKYDQFADIGDGFSAALLAVLDAQPEHVAMLNAHLQFYHDYLEHLLLQHIVGAYKDQLKLLLEAVEGALMIKAVEEKLRVLERFDDEHTGFGRFLEYNIEEYLVEKFSL